MNILNLDEIRKNLNVFMTQQQIFDVILESFDSLQLDNDKVELCWALLSEAKLFSDFSGLHDKSADLSEKCRLEGNRAFAQRNDLLAIRNYTLAAGHAPPDSKELVLAIANRSAVTSCLNHHINCLHDIDFALKRNYPENLKYKLLERKGKSLISLAQFDAAASALQDALNGLSLSDLTDSKLDKVKFDISDLLVQCKCQSDKENLVFDYTEENHLEMPDLSYGRHETITSASRCIDICYSEDMGRHLVANRDIQPGDVLAVEKPYVAILLPESTGLYCSYCLKRCCSLLPCVYCPEAYFCSCECEREASSRFHKVECGLWKALLKLGCTKLELLAVRTVVEASCQGSGLVDLAGSVARLDLDATVIPPAKRGYTDSLYDSGSYAAVHSLEGNSHHRSSMDLFRRAIAAAFIVQAIDVTSSFFNRTCEDNTNKYVSSFFDSSKNSDHCRKNIFSSFKLLEPYFRESQVKEMGEMKAFVGGLLLKYLQVMPSNAHEVSEMFIDRSAKAAESIEVGGALYPLLSLTNHSCDPNVVRHSYHGDTVVLTAIQVIPAGYQIFDNYGYHHAVHDKQLRQTSLLSQYFFSCHCRACLNDWPLYDNMPAFQPKYLPGFDVNKIEESTKKFRQVVTDMLNSNGSEKLPFLVSHLKLLHESLEMPWKDYSACQEAIKQCLSLRANHYLTKI